MVNSHDAHAVARFNSRTREGCDSGGKAPAYASTSFQFTHPGGVRRLRSSTRSPITSFQFTHPGGVRRSTHNSSFSLYAFQFTHPGGVRHQLLILNGVRDGFQFTHPGGVRPSRGVRVAWPSVGFNSRTREGCDRRQLTRMLGDRVSIHAPGRGATSWLYP